MGSKPESSDSPDNGSARQVSVRLYPYKSRDKKILDALNDLPSDDRGVRVSDFLRDAIESWLAVRDTMGEDTTVQHFTQFLEQTTGGDEQ